jgi:hypothetical protein
MEHLALILLDIIRHWCSPPGPSEVSVKYADGHSVLYAAGVMDQHGEWNEALRLYARAAMLLRGHEDGVYAENCRKEVQKKIGQLGSR